MANEPEYPQYSAPTATAPTARAVPADASPDASAHATGADPLPRPLHAAGLARPRPEADLRERVHQRRGGPRPGGGRTDRQPRPLAALPRPEMALPHLYAHLLDHRLPQSGGLVEAGFRIHGWQSDHRPALPVAVRDDLHGGAVRRLLLPDGASARHLDEAGRGRHRLQGLQGQPRSAGRRAPRRRPPPGGERVQARWAAK